VFPFVDGILVETWQHLWVITDEVCSNRSWKDLVQPKLTSFVCSNRSWKDLVQPKSCEYSHKMKRTDNPQSCLTTQTKWKELTTRKAVSRLNKKKWQPAKLSHEWTKLVQSVWFVVASPFHSESAGDGGLGGEGGGHSNVLSAWFTSSSCNSSSS